MRIVYSDESKQTFAVIQDDGDIYYISNPPGSPEDQQLIDEYGGLFEIERTGVDMAREFDALEDRWEKFKEREDKYAQSLTIDAIMAEEITPTDAMKIKMSMFKHEYVRACKNKELLTDLRKAEDIVDIIKTFGLIRDETRG